MEAASLWAGVRFTARNGSPEALLTDAAGQGLHLYGVFSLPGGFTAIAQHGSTDGWPHLPGTGGCGCGWKSGKDCIFCCARCCGAKGYGPGLSLGGWYWSGCKGLYGRWTTAA